MWFVRNHAQRGPASGITRDLDPDGRHLVAEFKGVFDHLSCLLRSVEHCFLHKELNLSSHFKALRVIEWVVSAFVLPLFSKEG